MAIHRKNIKKLSVRFFFNRSAVVQLIILTSIISLFGFLILGIYPNSLLYFALQASNILEGRNLWTLFTHMFFHADFFHLFVNMFSLFFIGNAVEMIIGRKRFLQFYLVSGVVAGLIYVAFASLGSTTGLISLFGDVNTPAVGASGAIFGLLGILAVLVPKKKVYLILGPLILIVLQVVLVPYVPSAYSVIFSLVVNVLLLFMVFSIFYPQSPTYKFTLPISLPLWLAPIVAIVPLVLIGFYVNLPIGNTAHLGGLLAGLLYGAYLRIKYKKKIALLQKVFT